jgi:spermidine/putrescine transport system substrate-binding protein
LLLLVSLCCAARAADEHVLNLLCWTEYVPASVTESFTQKTGARVVMENYNSNEQMLAMLHAKPEHYDLVQPSQAYVEGLIQSRGLEELDAAKIPNLRNLDPQYRGLPHDPDGKFSVPWMAGTMGIAVNTDAVKEPIHTWADVFSGKYSGRIVAVNDQREMVAWALASLMLPITHVDDGALAKTEPVLRKWLPQIAVFDSDNPHTAMTDGRAAIGIMWSGEAALLWQQDHKFQYVLPNEGAHMFLDSLAIPAQAPHKKLAEEFINHCLDPKVSVLISKEYPYTNPNLAARHLLTAEQLANPASYPPNADHLLPLRNIGNDTKAVDSFVHQIRDSLGK